MVYSATRVFTGDAWLQDAAIHVEGNTIKDVYQAAKTDSRHFENAWVIPAFIDAQVYGAAGKLFSLYPEAATLQQMESVFAAGGTALFQPTVATNTLEVVHRCIDAVRAYRSAGGSAVYGLHLEGPWLNPQKKGAHIAAYIHAPEVGEVEALLQYGKDVITMVTLAPEICSIEIIRLLRGHGIRVSAGHSATDYATAMKSFDAGITAVTHLYNAMSPLQHREPGLVGAAFEHATVCASIIPDGHHVDGPAIRIAKKMMGARLFAITDAVTDTDEGPYRHQRDGDKFVCNGTLSGSAISMLDAARNLAANGIDMDEALRMCSLYPAKLLGLDRTYGRVAPGYAAKLLVVTPELEFIALINGQG